MYWSKLSMADRAKYIELAVANGVTHLGNIRNAYNSYAEGGDKSNDESPKDYLDIALNFVANIGNPTEMQHQLNRLITNEQVVDGYMNDIMYTMENPESKGYRDGKWYPYTDKDKDGNIHINLGPGINKNSDVGSTLDYNGRGYTTKELNTRLRPDLLNKMSDISSDLHELYGERADTMSIGNKMILLDIAHNVRPRGKRKNMPSEWPKLHEAMMSGDAKTAKKEMDSGSERRTKMRGDLLYKAYVNSKTVKNR